MGSFSSKARTHNGQASSAAINPIGIANDTHSTGDREGESKVADIESEQQHSKLSPSYSWLIASPVDFDTNRNEQKINRKKISKQRSSNLEYRNGKYVKYWQHPAEPPREYGKRKAMQQSASSSSSSENHSPYHGSGYGGNNTENQSPFRRLGLENNEDVSSKRAYFPASKKAVHFSKSV